MSEESSECNCNIFNAAITGVSRTPEEEDKITIAVKFVTLFIKSARLYTPKKFCADSGLLKLEEQLLLSGPAAEAIAKQPEAYAQIIKMLIRKALYYYWSYVISKNCMTKTELVELLKSIALNILKSQFSGITIPANFITVTNNILSITGTITESNDSLIGSTINCQPITGNPDPPENPDYLGDLDTLATSLVCMINDFVFSYSDSLLKTKPFCGILNMNMGCPCGSCGRPDLCGRPNPCVKYDPCGRPDPCVKYDPCGRPIPYGRQNYC